MEHQILLPRLSAIHFSIETTRGSNSIIVVRYGAYWIVTHLEAEHPQKQPIFLWLWLRYIKSRMRQLCGVKRCNLSCGGTESRYFFGTWGADGESASTARKGTFCTETSPEQLAKTTTFHPNSLMKRLLNLNCQQFRLSSFLESRRCNSGCRFRSTLPATARPTSQWLFGGLSCAVILIVKSEIWPSENVRYRLITPPKPNFPSPSRRSRRIICRSRATSKKAHTGIRKRPGLNNTEASPESSPKCIIRPSKGSNPTSKIWSPMKSSQRCPRQWRSGSAKAGQSEMRPSIITCHVLPKLTRTIFD